MTRRVRLIFLAFALPALVAARPDARDGEVVRLPSLVVDAEARAIVTVQVPVPESMRDLVEVGYVVRLMNGATVVGPASGILAVQRSSSRSLVVTLRVPADVRAGPLDVAEVEFRAGDRTPVVQPVTVRIPLRRQVTALGTREVPGLRSGDRVDLTFRLVNEGNAPEALTVMIRTPERWTIKPQGPRTIVIPRGEQVEVNATVAIPENAGVGDHSIILEAGASWPPTAAPLTQFRTVLRVSANASTSTGLMFTPIIATATSSDGSATFAGATLEGPVSENALLRARLLPRARQSGIVAQGLSSVGAFAAPFSASLWGRDWDISAGNALVQLSDLTGVNIFGEGLTGSATRGSWQGRAVASRPSSMQGATGRLMGAGLWRETGLGRVGGSASYLSEVGGMARGRDLTAVAADYTSHPLGTLTVSGSLAYRESFGQSGTGATFVATHDRPQDRVSLRIAHAPGGSLAFARATDELQLSGGRSLSEDWTVDGAFSRSRDRGNVFRSLAVDAWSLGQRYAFTRSTSVTLRGQVTDFNARSASGSFGGFGAGNRDVTAGWEYRKGLVALSGEGSLGAMVRRTELLDGRTVRSVAGQRGARLFASRALVRLGALDGSLGVQFTEAGAGVPGDVWIWSGRWAGIPLSSGRRNIRLDTEAQYQQLGGIQSFLVARTSVVMTLPGGLDLAFSAERNPYYRDAAGRAGWIAAMRLSAASLVRAASASGDEGVVYADRDGNGRRDPGEDGVPGVVLRRGDARVVSDRDGHYRMPARARGRVRVDQGSLPEGLLAHPLVAADTLERRDIPLLTTGTVLVALRLVPSEDGRTPEVSLKEARVMLRDDTGFEWVGRHMDDSTLVFEDIPVGNYVPRFDLSMVGEPLRFDEAIGVLVLPRERRTVLVPMRGRTVRVTTPPRAGQRQRTRQ